MRNFWIIAFTAACLVVAPARSGLAAQSIIAEIDLSEQRLRVIVDGAVRHVWPVSTARPGYRTPLGTYRPVRLERSWYSRRYDNAPMPHSIFFYRGYAIHGTTEIKTLGRPVSHGCVRLHPDHAATLFALVKANRAATRIRVVR